MKYALVTGHEGFVGRHLTPKLKAAGYEVIGTEDLQETIASYGWLRFGGRGQQFDVIVHLAANIRNVDDRMKGGMSAYSDMMLDYQMCLWVEHNPPREAFIAMSSCAVDYPADPYCIVKRTLEVWCKTLHKRDVPVIVLRPFSGYGADQSTEYPFPSILERVKGQQNPLEVWGGDQIRDWIHIEDLTDAIIYSIGNFPRGTPVDVGTGIGTSLADLALNMARASGYDPALNRVEKAKSSPYRVADAKQAAECGWVASISLRDGIRMALGTPLQRHPDFTSEQHELIDGILR